jgi:hypothetical protein
LTSSNIPRGRVNEVIDAFKDSYASSLRVAYAIVAVGLALGALLAFVVLRKLKFSEAGGTVATHPLAAHAHPIPAPTPTPAG